MGPTTIDNRYLFEDIPTGLVPLALIGEAIGVPTPNMKAVVQLGNLVLDRDFWQEGRTLKKLGIEGLSKDEILQMVL